MLLHSSPSDEVPVNVRGALEAAHDAIQAFFVLYEVFEAEAKVWWVFNHRAFLEALCIGGVLREVEKEVVERDPLFVRGKGDIGEFSFQWFLFVRWDEKDKGEAEANRCCSEDD